MLAFIFALSLPTRAVECDGVISNRNYVAPLANPCSGTRVMSYYSKVKFGTGA